MSNATVEHRSSSVWLTRAIVAVFLTGCGTTDVVEVGLYRVAHKASAALDRLVREHESARTTPMEFNDVDLGVDDREAPGPPLAAEVQVWLENVAQHLESGKLPAGVEVQYQSTGGLPLLAKRLAVTSANMQCIKSQFNPRLHRNDTDVCRMPINAEGVDLVKRMASPLPWRGLAPEQSRVGDAPTLTFVIRGPREKIERRFHRRPPWVFEAIWWNAEALCKHVLDHGTCSQQQP